MRACNLLVRRQCAHVQPCCLTHTLTRSHAGLLHLCAVPCRSALVCVCVCVCEQPQKYTQLYYTTSVRAYAACSTTDRQERIQSWRTHHRCSHTRTHTHYTCHDEWPSALPRRRAVGHSKSGARRPAPWPRWCVHSIRRHLEKLAGHSSFAADAGNNCAVIPSSRAARARAQ